MKVRCLLIPAWIVAMATAHAEDRPAVDAAGWVEQLSDESFQVRERASRALWGLGESALQDLEAAASSSDPERAVRAREILRKIQLHITPDTDSSVIGLVERYSMASPAEKITLLSKMQDKRAWWQILKLYAAETDETIRRRLESQMVTLAILAARERIVKSDATSARQFLELAPATASALRALADFHRSHGTLDEELARAKALQGPKGAAWRMALHAAAGDLASAREEALAAGELERAAVFSAMTGDPLPCLRLAMRENEDNPLRANYARIALKRWQDGKVRPADLESLKRAILASDGGEAFGALFLLGENAQAEQLLAKSRPLAAFIHFDSLERIPEALQAIGLDPENPDYQAWVASRFKVALDTDIEDQHEVSDEETTVRALVNFMERRGLHEEALEAFRGPMEALAESDAPRFTELLGRLFSPAGAPTLARALALRWAGDNEARWDEVVTAAFGEDDEVAVWWDWLAEIRPEAERAERLDAMMALFALNADPADTRGKWLAAIRESLAAAPAAEQPALAARLFEWASRSGTSDVEVALYAIERLDPPRRDKLFFGQLLYQFSAVDRWQDAADVILRQMQIMREAGKEPGADLHAYAAAAQRMAGREEEAARHDAWTDKLALGSPDVAFRIANGYAYGRDYGRAQVWWQRAVAFSGPEGSGFMEALKSHADHLIDTRSWREAAALSELLALQHLGSDYLYGSHLPLMRLRLQSDTARAIAGLSQNRSLSLELLARCHRNYSSDGSLADFFFPALREEGLLRQHDAWFEESWRHFEQVIRRFPRADNVRNTAAWFASRAMRKLDAAEGQVRKALELRPRQSAYLDTLAEIHFARGQRAKALQWSNLAINYTPEDLMLRRQHERFRSGDFPK